MIARFVAMLIRYLERRRMRRAHWWRPPPVAVATMQSETECGACHQVSKWVIAPDGDVVCPYCVTARELAKP